MYVHTHICKVCISVYTYVRMYIHMHIHNYIIECTYILCAFCKLNYMKCNGYREYLICIAYKWHSFYTYVHAYLRMYGTPCSVGELVKT